MITKTIRFSVILTIEANSEEDYHKKQSLVKYLLKWFNSRTNVLQIRREEITKYISDIEVFVHQ